MLCHLDSCPARPAAPELTESLLMSPCSLDCSIKFLRTGERGEGGAGVCAIKRDESGEGVRGTRKLAGRPSLKSRPDETLVVLRNVRGAVDVDLRLAKEGSDTIVVT